MSRVFDNELTGGPRSSAPPAPRLGDEIPTELCRLCWHDRFVWRDGVWMLHHRGSLDECAHDCHDQTFLPSVS